MTKCPGPLNIPLESSLAAQQSPDELQILSIYTSPIYTHFRQQWFLNVYTQK